MKLKAFPIVAVLGTIAAFAAGCVVTSERPADSTPQTATPQPPPPAPATAAPAETATATPATTATAAPAPTPGRMLSKPKAPAADAGAADGG
jgi:hypothetical protein